MKKLKQGSDYDAMVWKYPDGKFEPNCIWSSCGGRLVPVKFLEIKPDKKKLRK